IRAGPSGLDRDVLTFHIAQLAEALAEGLETALSCLVGDGARGEITDQRHLLPRLGTNGDRCGKEQNKYGGSEASNHEPRQSTHAATPVLRLGRALRASPTRSADARARRARSPSTR